MKRTVAAVTLAALASWSVAAQQRTAPAPAAAQGARAQAAPYFPERLNWQHKRPDEVGMNAALVAEAVTAATSREISANRDLNLEQATTLRPQRAVRHGHRAAQTARARPADSSRTTASSSPSGASRSRVDVSNSVTKTFLTTVIGLAWQRGLIRDLNDYARDYMPPGVDLFEAEHNQKIRWEHLLRQTSDWQGTLWGKPDWADRPEGKTRGRLAEPSAARAGNATSSTTTCA